MQNFSWPFIGELSQQLMSATKWAEIHLATWSTLAQVACIIIAFVAAFYLSKQAAQWLSVQMQRRKRLSIIRIHASNGEIFFCSFRSPLSGWRH